MTGSTLPQGAPIRSPGFENVRFSPLRRLSFQASYDGMRYAPASTRPGNPTAARAGAPDPPGRFG